MKKAAAILVLLCIAATPGFGADRRGPNRPPGPLRMEQLEVRGIREKPDVLYLPVHHGMSAASPVRYDLFLVDMLRPVTPGDLEPQTPRAGGNRERRSIP